MKMKKLETDQDDDNPNIEFLSSNLNNMLVCGVLTGVNLSLKGQNPQYINKFMLFKFNELVVLNPKHFEK
jgi:hypothetical protein